MGTVPEWMKVLELSAVYFALAFLWEEGFKTKSLTECSPSSSFVLLFLTQAGWRERCPTSADNSLRFHPDHTMPPPRSIAHGDYSVDLTKPLR